MVHTRGFIYVPTGSSALIVIQEQNKTLTDSPLLLDCKTVGKTVGFSLKISKEIGKVSPTLTPTPPPPAETKTFLKETWDQGKKVKMAPLKVTRVFRA